MEKNKENEGKTVLGRRKPEKQKKILNLSQEKIPKTFLNPFYIMFGWFLMYKFELHIITH